MKLNIFLELPFIKVMRPKQWLKQVLIILPLIVKINDFHAKDIMNLFLGLIGFTCASIGIYIFNDLSDIDEDRLSEAKKNRPIASGKIDVKQARLLSFVSLILSVFITFTLPNQIKSTGIISIYIIINIIYSKFKLKAHSTIGILFVAFGFPMRFAYGVSILGLKESYWAFVLILQIALVMLAGKRFQSQRRLQSRKSKSTELNGDHDFWLLGLVIYSALFISTYSAFISQASVQQTWGRATLLISTIPIGLGLVRYVEIATHPEKLLLEDVTESFIKDLNLIFIFTSYVLIMGIGILTKH